MHSRPNHPRTQFGAKLYNELERQGVTNRELARRLAPHDPSGMRRSVARWLAPADGNPVTPNESSRRAIEEALGLESGALADEPDEDDLMTPLTRAITGALGTFVERQVERHVKRAMREMVA